MFTNRRSRILTALAVTLVAISSPLSAQNPRWTKLPAIFTSTPDLFGVHFLSATHGFVCGRVGSSTGRLYETTDGGTSWTTVALPEVPTSLNDLLFIAGSGFGIVVGDNGYIATTADGGITWTRRFITDAWPAGGDIFGVYFSSLTTGYIVGRALTTSGPRFARTVNGGGTWTNVAQTGPANNLYDVAMFDSLHGVAVGTGRLSRKSATTDGGATWESNARMNIGYVVNGDSASISLYGLTALPDGVGYASGGKVYYPAPVFPEVRKTTDYGATWQPTALSGPASGFTVPANDVIAVSRAVVFVSANNGKIYRTMNGGISWNQEALPASVGAVNLRKFCGLRDGTLFVVGDKGTILRYDPSRRAGFPITMLRPPPVCPEASRRSAIPIVNTGTATLTIDSAVIADQPDADIKFSVIFAPDSIGAGLTDSVIIEIRAGLQATPGTYRGTLEIRTDDEDRTGADTLGSIVIAVTIPRTILITTASTSTGIDFGRVRVGDAATATIEGILQNDALCPDIIDSIVLDHGGVFALESSDPDGPIQPGHTFSAVIRFRPVVSCEARDTLRVHHRGNPEPLVVPIIGVGIESTFRALPGDTLEFGSVGIAEAASRELEILNDNDGRCLDSLRIDTVLIIAPDNIFTITSPSRLSGLTVVPYDRLRIEVTAVPDRPGAIIGKLVVLHDGARSGSDTVILRVRGLAPELTITEPSIIFALTAIGDNRDTIVGSYLSNLSGSDVTVIGLRLSGAYASNFAVEASTPYLLPAKTHDSLTARFLPTAPLPPKGIYQATLEIDTDIPSTLKVDLIGFAEWPALSVSSRQIFFSVTPVRSCRDTMLTAYIHNPGRIPLRLGRPIVVDAPGGFSEDTAAFKLSDPLHPLTLDTLFPGQAIPLHLRFCPNRIGEHRALLRLASNAERSPVDIELIGSGIENLLSDVDSIFFPTVRVGTRTDLTVRALLLNHGIDAVTIDSLVLVGQDAASFAPVALPTFPFALAPSQALDLDLRFMPSRRGYHRAALRIVTSTGALEIRIGGSGRYPLLIADVIRSQPINVRLGRTDRIEIPVINVGDDNALISTMTFNAGPAFRDITLPPGPIEIAPGDTVLAGVLFAPVVPCGDTLLFTLQGDGVAGRYTSADTTVAIVCGGIAPSLSASASHVDLGRHAPGAVIDTVLGGILSNGRSAGLPAPCSAPAVIDSIRIIGSDADRFTVSSAIPLPFTLAPGASIDIAIEFRPQNARAHVSELEIYFDGDGDSVRRIELRGAGETEMRVELGEAVRLVRPGELLRIPLSITGNLRPSDLDSTVVHLSYRSTMLRPLRPLPVPGVAISTFESVLNGDDTMARTSIGIECAGNCAPGDMAEIEFLVLLGDRLESMVRVDSVTVPRDRLLSFVVDSMRLAITDFCDADERLIRFNKPLKLATAANPSSEDCEIRFTLTFDGTVRLSLFDPLGNEAVRPVDGSMSAGLHVIRIPARELAEGVYYCRLTAGAFSETLALVVMR